MGALGKFVVVDVETANSKRSSICQIGVVVFDDGRIVDEWSSLVDPEESFGEHQQRVHRICANDVRGKPNFPKVASQLRGYLESETCVSHSVFDQQALVQTHEKYGMHCAPIDWLNSFEVACKAWPEFGPRGHSLPNLCYRLGYEYKAHDALEDARAAGYILLCAMRHHGLDIKSIRSLVDVPGPAVNDKNDDSALSLSGPGKPLLNEVVLFTGDLCISRDFAEDLAIEAGARVSRNVSKKVTILVVGTQDLSKLKGHEKSGKHRAVDELIAQGRAIKIVNESHFHALVGPLARAADPRG